MSKLTVIDRQTILSSDEEQLHFPFLHEAADGVWHMTYREGPHGVPGGDRVQCVRSEDRGATWQTHPSLKPSPSLRLFYQKLSDGALLANRYVSEVNPEGGRFIDMLRSEDDGETWLEHRAPITGIPVSADEPIRLGFWGKAAEPEPERLLQGCYHKPGDFPYKSGDKYVNAVLESVDGGRSWQFLSNVCTDTSLGVEGADEQDLEVLPNGDILTVFRTGSADPIYQARSEDGGRSWSEPEPSGVTGVSPQLLLLGNGMLIHSYGTRDVQVQVSEDGTGRAWSAPLLIYKGEGSGYTHLQSLAPGRFRAVYDESSFSGVQEGGNRIVRVEVEATAGV